MKSSLVSQRVSQRVRQRVRRSAWVLGALLVGLGAMGLGTSAAKAAPISAASSAAGGSIAQGNATTTGSCPAGATCATVPSSCPAGTHCPTVEVEPATGLTEGQWVYLNLSDFPTGSTADVYFCENKTPVTDSSPPSCLLQGSADLVQPWQQVPVFPNGTGLASFATEDDPNSGGNTPLAGAVPGDSSVTENFFCGDAADPCSVDVVDSSLMSTPPQVPVPEDTAVIPLQFAPQSNGCQTATQVPTVSDFSIEELIPQESPVACKQPKAAIAVDTAMSTTEALQNLQSGAADVGFVDDPQSADITSALDTATQKYAVVPVVASAAVMGYLAAMESEDGLMYPFDSLKMTPNEAAGVYVYNYQGPYDADVVKCSIGQCSEFEALNSVAGYTPAGGYGDFPPAAASGVTWSFLNWACSAPNLPFTVNGQSIHDPNTAKATLTTSTYYPRTTTWPIKNCTTTDELPPLVSPSAGTFNPTSDPAHQVKYLRGFAPPVSFQGSPLIGFAPMDWGDARFNGLSVASLQNAAGQFVAPSEASVQAEVSNWTISKSGYPVPDVTRVIKGGYPLSTVIDALIPEEHVSKFEKADISTMMTSLLDYTTHTAQLPDGYEPLPAKLATLAHKELAAALAAETDKTTATTTTTTTTTTQPYVPPTVTGTTTGTGTGSGTTPPNTKRTTTPTTVAVASKPAGKKTGSSNRSLADVTLATAATAFALPGALAAGGSLLVLSLGLSVFGRVRRRGHGSDDA